jgi:hypothetical protein
VQGKNFQESLHVDYTTDAQTTQDTMQIYGGWVTLHGAQPACLVCSICSRTARPVFNASLK